MIKIEVKQRLDGGPNYKMFYVEVPAIPPAGSYIASDKDGFAGRVHEIQFYWDEEGALTIEVEIK